MQSAGYRLHQQRQLAACFFHHRFRGLVPGFIRPGNQRSQRRDLFFVCLRVISKLHQAADVNHLQLCKHQIREQRPRPTAVLRPHNGRQSVSAERIAAALVVDFMPVAAASGCFTRCIPAKTNGPGARDKHHAAGCAQRACQRGFLVSCQKKRAPVSAPAQHLLQQRACLRIADARAADAQRGTGLQAAGQARQRIRTALHRLPHCLCRSAVKVQGTKPFPKQHASVRRAGL